MLCTIDGKLQLVKEKKEQGLPWRGRGVIPRRSQDKRSQKPGSEGKAGSQDEGEKDGE